MLTIPPIPPSIYFGGCAYGSCYYIGVYRAMLEIWGSDFASKTLLTGDSAGIIFVIGITLKYEPEFIGDIYRNTGECTPWGLLNTDSMSELDKHTLRKLISGPDNAHPMKNTYLKLNKRIKIGGSLFPDKHYWCDTWESDEDLLKSMRNSLHMPIVCHRKYHTPHERREVVDGAFCWKGQDMAHGDRTLYIGTNKGADIFAELTTRQKVFPNLGVSYSAIEEIGYTSFMNWVSEGAIIKKKVGVRKVRYPVQCILWTLKVLQIMLLGVMNLFEGVTSIFIVCSKTPSSYHRQ